jgi:[ribosomal protein S5]-alanine N-acetyltransferase
MKLKTPSSLLRPWSEGDCCALVRHADNPRIAVFMRDGFSSPYNHANAEQFITMVTGDHPHIFLAIEIDGQAVGGIGIHILEDIYRRTAEIGYWLSEEFWGRGIVSDAVRTILPVAFSSRDLIRIQAGVFSNNPGSMRVLEKNGFSLESIHKRAITKQGKSLDEYLYTIFRETVIR